LVAHQPLAEQPRAESIFQSRTVEQRTDKTLIIYLVTNQISGKKYVGQTILSLKKRWRGHCDDSKRKNTPFYAAIRKYGVGAFAVEALCDVPDDNPSLLDALEDWYIQYHNSLHPKGYNLSVEGALHLTKNSIDKMSKSLTGRKLTPEHKKNIGIASKKKMGYAWI